MYLNEKRRYRGKLPNSLLLSNTQQTQRIPQRKKSRSLERESTVRAPTQPSRWPRKMMPSVLIPTSLFRDQTWPTLAGTSVLSDNSFSLFFCSFSFLCKVPRSGSLCTCQKLTDAFLTLLDSFRV